jgi:D-xylose transport system permease protein
VLTAERSNNPFLISVRGVPIVVPLIAVLLVVWTFVLKCTGYGRHIYAVGGNAEAARRAGIDVDRIRISAFMIGSFMAAVGGVVAASRANSVDPNTGGSNGLMGFSSGQKFIFTGLVLLVAASIDAVSRRRASATGNG